MDQWTRQKRNGQTTEINIDLGQLSAYHKVTQTLNHFEQSSPQLRLFSHLDQVTLRANAYLNNEFDELTFGVFFISLCSQPLPIIKWSIVLKFSLGLF